MTKLLSYFILIFINILGIHFLAISQEVDKTSGEFNYSKTILEVPSPNGSYPIILNYQSGISSNDESSWIGLGWDFHPGAIQRTINDTPDDYYGLYETQISSTNINFGSIYEENYDKLIADYWANNATWKRYTEQQLELMHGRNKHRRNSKQVRNDRREINSKLPGPPDDLDNYKNKLFKTKLYGILYLREFYNSGMDVILNKHKNFINPDNSLTINYSMDVLDVYSKSSLGMLKNEQEVESSLIPAKDNYAVTVPSISGQIAPSIYGLTSLLSRKDGEKTTSYLINDKFKHNYSYSYNDLVDEINFRYENSPSNKALIDVQLYNLSAANLTYDSKYVNPEKGKIMDRRDIQWYKNADVTFIENNAITNDYNLMIHPYLTNNLAKIDPNENRNTLYLNVENYWEFKQEVAQDRTENGGYKIKGLMKDFDVSQQIGAFLITDENGYKYHFSLPVYEYGVFNYQRTKMDRGANSPDHLVSFSEREYPAAYKWELFAITGPDFVDMNNNHMPDEHDLGYWVRFDYGLWTREYKFRNPKNGFSALEENQNLGSVTMGKREIYYLNSIKTPTHTALFLKEMRDDNKGLSVYKRFRQDELNGFGYLYEDIYNVKLKNESEIQELYFPYYEKPSNHPDNLNTITNQDNYASWPTSVCGLSKIFLFKNDILDEVLLNNGLTTNGEPDLGKLYARSGIANNSIAMRPMGTKSIIHLGSDILDDFDIDGLSNDILHTNSSGPVTIPASQLNSINNFYSNLSLEIILEHDYSLSPWTFNSFELNYNHFTARDNYNSTGNYFDHSTYVPHNNATVANINMSSNQYLERKKKGKYTLKSVETKNHEGKRISKIGEFRYDHDFTKRDNQGNILPNLNHGYFNYFQSSDSYEIDNITDFGAVNPGDIILVELGAISDHFYFFVRDKDGSKLFAKLIGKYDFNNQIPSFQEGNYNFKITKNPPEGLNYVDENGDYNPDISNISISNNPITYRTPTEAGSKSKDVWSLRGVENSDGSVDIFNYESNTINQALINQNQIISFNNATYIAGQGVKVDIPNGLDCNKYFPNQNEIGDIVCVFRYQHSNQPCGGTYNSNNLLYKQNKFRFETILFKDANINLDCPNNQLIIQNDALYKTIDNNHNNPVNSSIGYSSFHPEPIGGNLGNGCTDNLIYHNPPIVMSISIRMINSNGTYSEGIRVKSISHIDGEDQIITQFNYNLPSGITSGKKLIKPAPINNQVYNSPVIDGMNDAHAFFNYKMAYNKANSILNTNNNFYRSISNLLPDVGVVYSRITETTLRNGFQTDFSTVYENLNYKSNLDWSFKKYNSTSVSSSTTIDKMTNIVVKICPQAGLKKKISTYYKNLLYTKTEFYYSHENNLISTNNLNHLTQNFNSQGVIEEAYFERRHVVYNDNPLDELNYDLVTKISKYSPLLIGEKRFDYKRRIFDEESHLTFDFISGGPNKTIARNSRDKITVSETAKAADLNYHWPHPTIYSLYPEMASNYLSGNNKNMLTRDGKIDLYFAELVNNQLQKVSDIGKKYYTYHTPLHYYNEIGEQVSIPWSSLNTTVYKPFQVHNSNYEFEQSNTRNSNGTYNLDPIPDPPLYSNIENYEWGLSTSNPLKYDKYFRIVETENKNSGNYASKKFGYKGAYIIAKCDNAKYNEMAFSGAESEYSINPIYFEGGVQKGEGSISTSWKHTGSSSLYVQNQKKGFVFSTTLDRPNKFLVSVWIRNFEANTPEIRVKIGNPIIQSLSGGQIITQSGDWSLVNFNFEYSGNGDDVNIEVFNTNSSLPVYMDDFRFHPVNSKMNSYVYNKRTGKVQYELDNHNFYSRSEEIVGTKSVTSKLYRESINGEKLISETIINLKEQNR